MVISVQQKNQFAFALDFEKRKVFNLFLKQPMESSGSRKSSGSEFQTVGEAWKKPRGPIVFVFVRGTTRRRSWNRAERREERVDDTCTGTQ